MTTPYGGIVSRARLKPDASPSGRIATSRRAERGPRADRAPAPTTKKAPAKAVGKGRSKGKKATAGPVARFFKLIVLLSFMMMLGFGVVLVVDVGLTLVGGIHLGSITFAELVDKVEARVFDRDLPGPTKKKTEATPRAKARTKVAPSAAPTTTTAPVITDRAELPAPSPDDYAKAVAPRKDVEVVEARARLDRLLKGL